ncbi:MAG: 4Fe-4S dicluster domain-containing protein, partial [Candidatus Aminicenantales bacterium]
LCVLFLWFSLTSLKEKEFRAFRRSGFSLVLVLGIRASLEAAPQLLRGGAFAVMALGVFGGALWLLLSPAPRKETEILAPPERVDERDTLFARFDLEEGSPRYKQYYSSHPEYASLDAEIRKFPDILVSPDKRKDPLLLSLAAAEFDFLEAQVAHVSGRPLETKHRGSAGQNTRMIKRVAQYLGSGLCGICRMDPAYVYSHVGRGPEEYGAWIRMDHPFGIVFALEMDLHMVSAAPGAAVIMETGRQYVEGARISIILASFIRRLGFRARAHIAGSNYQAMLPPLGWEAGLGEVGRLGFLITSRFGPRARLGLVTTDMPLVPDRRRVFGIQDFCEKCLKCARNCPARAIAFVEKQEINGVLKWGLDREACYRFWRKVGTDCAVCMAVCPYSKPDSMLHALIRKASSSSRAAQVVSIWGDDVFYGRRPVRRHARIRFDTPDSNDIYRNQT